MNKYNPSKSARLRTAKKMYAELTQWKSVRNRDKKLYDNKLIIDTDYYNNPDNEGEIFFQVINMSPYPIALKKGDIIGQGIIKKYHVTDDDAAAGNRVGGFGSTSTPLNQFIKKVENNLPFPEEMQL